jgi:plasmid maintenance system killer protein
MAVSAGSSSLANRGDATCRTRLRQAASQFAGIILGHCRQLRTAFLIIPVALRLSVLRQPSILVFGNFPLVLDSLLWSCIRINQQWRIVFLWQNHHAHQVSITDYH